jgi:uncharacterized protein (DUF2267 family)
MNLDATQKQKDERFHELVNQVRTRADLTDTDRASIALESVLFCITRRLAGDEVTELLERLPEPVRERFPEEPEADRSVDRQYVEEELARRLDVDSAAARQIATAIRGVLEKSEAATPAILRELRAIA